MAIDTTRVRSRRSLLTAALAGLAGAAATTVAGAQRVLASGDDGTAIAIGTHYEAAQHDTWVINNTNNADAFVAGSNQGGNGLRGFSNTGHGVQGESGTGLGVYGYAGNGIGVLGRSVGAGSPSMKGIKDSTNGHGVAVQGEIADSTSSFTAVYGVTSGSGVGVAGEGSAGGAGTYGLARGAGDGVYGESALGRGGRFKGKKAQIRLQPSGAATHPASGARGDLFVDKSGRLWFCKGTSIWKQLA